MKPRLTNDDYREVGILLGIPANLVRAVAEVESSGDGFRPDDRPKILFERHHFHRLTKGRFSAAHPNISSSRSGGYSGDEWQRLSKAMQLDKDAALKSASWGKFQIMGFNHKVCGYSTVQEFSDAMHESERKHLDAFAKFLIAGGLHYFLQKREYAKFARQYNGPNYAKNRYDSKIRKVFEMLNRNSNDVHMDLSTRNIQVLLKKNGYDPGAIDNALGEKTRGAIIKFQTDNRMKADGVISLDLLKALEGVPQ